MWIQLAVAAYMIGDYVYHRWNDKKPDPKTDEFTIPVTRQGAPVLMIFGRCRIREAVLAMTGNFYIIDTHLWGMHQAGGSDFLYGIDMFFVLGTPMASGVNRIYSIWAGDEKMRTPIYGGLDTLIGGGNHEVPAELAGPAITDRTSRAAVDYPCGFGLIEFLNGDNDQQLVDPITLVSSTYTADRLSANKYPPFSATTDTFIGGTINASDMPGYRGFMCVFMFSGNLVATSFPGNSITPSSDRGQAVTLEGNGDGITTHVVVLPWCVGASPEPPVYSFEGESMPRSPLANDNIAMDANPVDVMFDVLTDPRKLGLSTSLIDFPSWTAAATTVKGERNGYSRAVPSTKTRDLLMDCLRQVDGVIYPNYKTGKLVLKLIRADFNPATIPLINPDNCVSLSFVEAFGWTGLPNALRLTFTDRAKDYENNSATTDNEGNFYTQDGEFDGIELQFPGICTLDNAKVIAGREMSARSRPLMKLRATVDRSFIRLNPGDPVSVTWPEYHIGGVTFRVASPARGGRDANTVELDLIQDFGYTHRFEITDNGGLPVHPGQVAA
jgi:hypothetical protein